MFLFYSTEQSDSTRDHHKGKLFEELLGRYLDASGYEIQIRRRHASLEYDLEGVNRASHTKILGEAKAHGRPIAGQAFSAFVGKLLPLGLTTGTVTGLFLSTSALTPEADDYYASVERFGLVSHTGAQLGHAIRQALRLPEPEPLFRQLRAQGLDPKQHLLLATNVGDFLVVTAGSAASATASHFAVFGPNGSALTDPDFLRRLASSVPELQALRPVVGRVSSVPAATRDIPRGLTLGSDWTDYRLPAAPSFFIGRREFLKQVRNHIDSGRSPFVLQIKSRSGVGKSSALATLEHTLVGGGARTELHDARDVKSVLDVYGLVQRFTGCSSVPDDFRGVAEAMQSLHEAPGRHQAVFLVDQFESTFSNPDVFQAYESLAALSQGLGPSVYLVLARKNDQLTTYDDSLISLDRLNGMSRSYELRDFTNQEARELIDRINRSSATPITANVLAYVFEFAQGFPWLIKRTMAHLLRLLGTGVSQRELFAAGLRLDDLFDEELEGLDEIERDYLVRVAARLPADYIQLQRLFDDDPLLAKVLDKLTQARLLRLTGATYDTYNDVFKEYLVYRKLPEFRQPVIYRMYPGRVITTFRQLADLRSFTIDDLEGQLGLTRGSAFNQIRELRNLNLIRKEGERWSVPQTVLDVYNQGRLGEYVRRQLADNDIIARLVNAAAQGNPLEVVELPSYLAGQFPFVEASEETWTFYASVLRAWLSGLELLIASPDSKLVLPEADRKRILEDLGNLSNLTSRGRRTSHGLWLPAASFNVAIGVVRDILGGRPTETRTQKKALGDLRGAGWLEGDSPAFATEEEFRALARELLELGDYDEIWEAARQGDPLLPAIVPLIGEGLAEGTVRWYLKQLVSWAKNLGVIAERRYTYGTLEMCP